MDLKAIKKRNEENTFFNHYANNISDNKHNGKSGTYHIARLQGKGRKGAFLRNAGGGCCDFLPSDVFLTEYSANANS